MRGIGKLIVQKYGGTAVANAERIMNVARRVTERHRAGSRVVAVLSAQGGVTDGLLEKAREVNPRASKRELDMLLCTGEQQSAALTAMAVHSLGQEAISLNAAQAGIEATSLYGAAQIQNVRTGRVLAELARGRIVLVAGFQGVSRLGEDSLEFTTLGRGASDTTAVALAAVLKADLCEICKEDVDGVYTADPRIVPAARKLNAISYDDMLELASSGAKVLHSRAVEMAKRFGVRLLVRSSMSGAPGTWIKEDAGVEQLAVSGLAIDRNVARVSVLGLLDRPGAAFQIFSLLAGEKIPVDVILQTVGGGSTRDISFTVRKQDVSAACAALEALRDAIGYHMLTTDENLAKLSVVGAGMATNFGVAAAIFEALYERGVNIKMISTSEIKITVLVDDRQVTEAANAVHGKFAQNLEGGPPRSQISEGGAP